MAGPEVPHPSKNFEYCFLTPEQVLRAFSTDGSKGLSASQLAAHKEKYGENTFQEKEEETLLSKAVDQFKDPMILLLLGSAALSVLVGNYDDAFSITLAIAIVSTVAIVQEYRSEKSLQALHQMVPFTCHCVREGHTVAIPASDLVPGDIVRIATGDRIPADLRLLQASGLTVDESMLTGENKPSEKSCAPLPRKKELSITEQDNLAFMGTLVASGNGVGVVVGIAENTEFGHIYQLMQSIEDKKTPLQVKMDELGKRLSIASFVIIALILAVGLFQGRPWLQMFTIGVSLAVAAIPEGLPIVVTVTLALGVMRMAKRKAIVKKLPAVEALGSVNIVCSDKTGTLTQNKMTVVQAFTLASGEVLSSADHSLSPSGARGSADVQALLKTALLCNNAQRRADGTTMGQPTETALLDLHALLKAPDWRKSFERKAELPFSSERKMMVVECRENSSGKTVFFCKGAPESFLEACKFYLKSEQEQAPLGDREVDLVQKRISEMSSVGLRVLAFAYGDSMERLVFAGIIGMLDPLREGMEECILRLKQAGVNVVMITGDSLETAKAIGKMLRLIEDPVHPAQLMEGGVFHSLSEKEQRKIIGSIRIFYRAIPEHKVSIVSAHQARGSVVAMTGDGVNDAPALKMADVGIAMGMMGTDVSKEAADMILVDDNFGTILSAIEEGKSIYHNIKSFVRFQLSTSVAALALVVLSTVLGFPNPLNAMQILWINIIMDGPPAQSLGVEPVNRDVMKKPPRDQHAPILDSSLLGRVFFSALLIVMGTFSVYAGEINSSEGVVTTRSTTMAFTTFVMFDMFNALSCRSSEKPLHQIGLLTNRPFLLSIGLTLLVQLAVIYVPFMQSILQTEALTLGDLCYITLLSSSVFWLDEVKKLADDAITRAKDKQKQG